MEIALKETPIKFDSIPEAIEEIRNGRVVIVVDDADRENEGDFICAAECITPEIVNFMTKYGRGLICTPMQASRADELNLHMMVSDNTALHATAFTVSVDLLGYGCTTGISAQDRAMTIRALADMNMKASDFGRPGHIFPLKAKAGGVLRRTGHTEAAIDLAKLAGFRSVGVLVEILKEDGSMARLPDLRALADRFDLKLIAIKDLVSYRLKNERIIERVSSKTIDTQYGVFDLSLFKQTTSGDIHMALSKGVWDDSEDVLLRVHSIRYPSDVLAILLSNTDLSIRKSLELIEAHGKGVFLIMQHTDSQTGKLEQIENLIAGDFNQSASKVKRDIGVGAQICRDLGIRKINLITNHPRARIALDGYGLHIAKNTALFDSK